MLEPRRSDSEIEAKGCMMGDKRGRQNTHDTGAPTTRARDDLRTGSKKKKPNDQRDEGRDKKDVQDKADKGE